MRQSTNRALLFSTLLCIPLTTWATIIWNPSARETPKTPEKSASLHTTNNKISLKNSGPDKHQYNPTGINFIPLEIASTQENQLNLKAIHLADFRNTNDALNAWKILREFAPTLYIFRPYTFTNTADINNAEAEENHKASISLIAMLNQPELTSQAAQKIILDTCKTLKSAKQNCLPLNLTTDPNTLLASLNSAPFTDTSSFVKYMHRQKIVDTVMQRHLSARAKVKPLDNIGVTNNLRNISPAAGLLPPDYNNQSAFNGPYPQAPQKIITIDDTITQSAIRAAYDMVRNRYTDVIYQSQFNNDETPNLTTQDALTLSQSAITSAAQSAFEKFIEENFGKKDIPDENYEGLRGYFVQAFQQATADSIKSVGKRFVSDLTADGDFKSLKIRSELLKDIDENVMSAFIDTGLAAAKNSQYAFLRNLEVSYKLRDNNKPEYSIATLQPLFSSKERKHNLFAQAAFSREGSRNTLSTGLGYRYLPPSENYVVGSNIFFDYEHPYNHTRASAGLDFQTSLWGASTNFYKGLSDWHAAETGFQEKPMDGYDLELNGRMPFLPALEVFGRGYRWQGVDGVEDINGKEVRVEYSPLPAFTLQALWNDEEFRDTEFGLGIRYNYTFGAPPEYLYDWQEQFRKKTPSEYLFRKVQRENKIRVQKRVDPDSVATPIGPSILSASPLNGATNVSIGTNVTLTFAADVLAGTGNIVFTDLTNGSDNFTIPVGDTRVSIVNDTVTIDLSAQLLDFNSNYDITFAAGVFTDTSLAPSPAIESGDYTFTTIVDPTAGFAVATTSVAPNTIVSSFSPANTTATWQTTINVGAAPNGIIFESGATGQGIAAWFNAGNLVFAAGDGSTSSTSAGSIFGSFPIASIPQGLHHFVFVAKPTAGAVIGVYMDGVRIITQSIGTAMGGTQWAGTNGAGYGLSNGNIRAGGNSSAITGATLTNNLSFYAGQQPADF